MKTLLRIGTLAVVLVMAGVAVVWFMHGFMIYWKDENG